MLGVVLGFSGGYILRTEKRDFSFGDSDTGLYASGDNQQKGFEHSKLEISEMVLDWIEGVQDERGVYPYGVSCDAQGSCTTTKDNRVGILTLWAWYKHYEVTGDESDVAVIESGLKTYLDESTVPLVQSHFWGCTSLYEMADSGLFDASIEDDAHALCNRIMYDPVYTDLVAGVVRTGIVPTLPLAGLTDGRKDALILTMEQNSLYELSVYVSDFVAKYQWDHNVDDLNRAKGLLNKAAELYKREIADGKYFGPMYECTMGVGALDVYKVTDEQIYLDTAESLFDESPILSSRRLDGKSVCGYFAGRLADTTGDPDYSAAEDELDRSLIANMFDYEGYEGLNLGLGSFRTINTDKALYGVFENCVIAGHFLSEELDEQ